MDITLEKTKTFANNIGDYASDAWEADGVNVINPMNWAW